MQSEEKVLNINAYITDEMQKSLKPFLKSYKSDNPNTVEILNDAKIHLDFVRSDGFVYEAGVFRKDLSYVIGSDMWAKQEIALKEKPKDVQTATGKYSWGGSISCFYGHFLLQSTARSYYFLQNSGKLNGIMFALSRHTKQIPDYFWSFVDLAGIPRSKIKIVDKMLQVSELHVPAPSCLFGNYWTEDFLLPFKNAVSKIEPAKWEKVYLSRTKLKQDRAITYGENDIEKIFAANGFKIIHPEKLSLAQQISVIRGARQIAGLIGSSLHNIIFAIDMPPKKMIMLNRTEAFNTQFMLNEMTKTHCDIIKVHKNLLPVSHAAGPFIVGLTSYFKKYLTDNNMVIPNIKSGQQKYARKFWKEYLRIYSTWSYIDLKNQGIEYANAADIVRIAHLAGYPRFAMIKYFLKSKLSISKAVRAEAGLKLEYYKKILSGKRHLISTA